MSFELGLLKTIAYSVICLRNDLASWKECSLGKREIYYCEIFVKVAFAKINSREILGSAQFAKINSREILGKALFAKIDSREMLVKIIREN